MTASLFDLHDILEKKKIEATAVIDVRTALVGTRSCAGGNKWLQKDNRETNILYV